jgi:hypothetical protein
MPQTSIPQNAIAGQPGMAFDLEASNRDVVSRIAAVAIPFGVYCELNGAGLLVPMQDSTTGTNFNPSAFGISLFDPLGVEENYVTFPVPASTAGSSSSGYLKGQSVPVMRKGRIWAATDGGGVATRSGPINVEHSSTGAHSQGVFTFSAVSAVSGNEIDIAPSVTVYNPDLLYGGTGQAMTDVFGNTYNSIPVEINL